MSLQLGLGTSASCWSLHPPLWFSRPSIDPGSGEMEAQLGEGGGAGYVLWSVLLNLIQWILLAGNTIKMSL